MCADEYGNGVAIGVGSGAGDIYHFYTLNGNKFTKTGQKYSFDYAPAFGLKIDAFVYALNGKVISEDTHRKYFYELPVYDTKDLSYLNRYFHIK